MDLEKFSKKGRRCIKGKGIKSTDLDMEMGCGSVIKRNESKKVL